MKIDINLQNQFTKENFVKIFDELITSKKDVYTNKILIPLGIDGIDYINISNNIDSFSKSLCTRALSGRYIFTPFREKLLPKAPFAKNELEQAIKAKKTRTLAICTIRDTIFQKMVYYAIYNFTDNKIKKFDNSIYGYRKNKSVKNAIEEIRKYIKQGYKYGIDGDIQKFFDEINHDKMKHKINLFYKNNPMCIKYLTRFLKVGRVETKNVFKSKKDYCNKKPIITPRVKGIPQGGVLSGILANVYLYNFDKYVSQNLANKYDLKYVRYADDFIVLTKTKDIIKELYAKLHRYFAREKLILHPIDMSAVDNSLPDNDKKTKAINFYSKSFIDFLGYRISPKFIGIKQDNIKKFKNSIKFIISECENKRLDIYSTIHKINARIMGNALFANQFFAICKKCEKPQSPQSWIGFFSNITDLRQLKSLDVWIRRQLYQYSHRQYKNYYGISKWIEKDYFRKKHKSRKKEYYYLNLNSLYYSCLEIKKVLRSNKNIEFCSCEHFIPMEEYTLS